MKPTQEFAALLAGLQYEDIPASTLHSAKEKLVDFIAVAIAGVQRGELFKALLPKARSRAVENGCVVIGTELRTAPEVAALMNGISSHSLDLDDGHRTANGHPSITVIPAALALSEVLERNGREFLLATIAGYETFVRLGTAFNPGIVRRGFHTTGVVGSLAAATAAAKLRGFDAEQITKSFGVAGLLSSGFIGVNHSGSSMKPLNAGHAAENGVTAAEYVALGANGALDILEGRDAFVQAYSGMDVDYTAMMAGFGEKFRVEQCYIKLYPACRHMHAAMDACAELRGSIDLTDIRSIEITAYPNALQLTKKDSPPTDTAGTRFNMAFACALALCNDTVGLEDFSIEMARRPDIAALFPKTTILCDPELESSERNIRGSVVAITTSKGTFRKQVLLSKGEPENPVTRDELFGKFTTCVGDFWSPAKTRRVFELIEGTEKLGAVRQLTQELSSRRD